MPEEGVPLQPDSQLLTTPEIVYLSSLFVSQGVTKIRLTGGEPTIRRDIVPLMQNIGVLRSNGLKQLCLTTNGISLHRKLDRMVEAGLTGVNLSLDTLDPFQFQIMTRRKGFDAVMRSIDRILEMNNLGAGIKLKINCVVMRGLNEREIMPFVEMGRDKDVEVRFIEYMPFDGNKWSKGKMMGYQEMLGIIRNKYPHVQKLKDGLNETSKTYEVPGFQGRFGFITSMTHNFCGTCNRLRITSDGNLKVCLFGNTEVSLRDLIRQDNGGRPVDEEAWEAMMNIELDRKQGLPGSTSGLGSSKREQELLEVIGMAVKRKKERHAGMGNLENMKNRPMILIDEHPMLPSQPPLFSETPWRPIFTSLRSLDPRLSTSPSASARVIQVLNKSPLRTRLFSTSSSARNADPNTPNPPPQNPKSHPAPQDARSQNNAQPSTSLPHLQPNSEIHIIPTSQKPTTHRLAIAIGHIAFSNPQPYILIRANALRKGDVLAVARVAGVMAAKKTAEWIPLCHNGVGLEGVRVSVELTPPATGKGTEGVGASEAGNHTSTTLQTNGAPHPILHGISFFGGISIRAEVQCSGKTGVEMEALTAVVGAALTCVDMCKGVDKGCRIEGVRVIRKQGGKSGVWVADGWDRDRYAEGVEGGLYGKGKKTRF
ncbi:MAG: hypothetical protein MMC33_005809 [Icmadophila ericetorum]|nr:hypothetical protein [Icmadophila ericetorum]